MLRTGTLRILLAATLLSLGSCGGTGDLQQDLAAASGEFVVVDLSTMTWSTRAQISDLAANPTYRDRYLVLRSVAPSAGVTGSVPGTFGAQSDEVRSSATAGRLILSVFELTQAQWERIAGTTPWTTLPSSVVGTADGAKAAVGLSLTDVDAALLALGTATISFRLPTATEWELACRAGSGGSYAWGEARDDDTVSEFAVVSETAGATVGPRVVGGRTANGYGLYDMHGNVWELTASGDIRGGSWRDSLPSARSANLTSLDQATSHPLVGARLVLEFR